LPVILIAMLVLIVTENARLARHIGGYLEQQGSDPDFASDGAFGLRLCASNRYDAIVLDQQLPDMDGTDFCRRLRENAGDPTPVLMLAAGGRASNHIRGLEAGADDCMSQPFSLPELCLRLQTIMRRRAFTCHQISAGGIYMVLDQWHVYWGEIVVELPPTGFRILELLVRAFPGIVTRAQMEHAIWDDQPPASEAALRGHIHRLRRSLEGPFGRRVIKTLHGVGYQFLPLA
jgi:DNA-binding response OmpR family regulator